MPLRITVINGDLTFVSQPLLLGHYQSLRLTGAEDTIDFVLERAMSKSLDVGVYPDRIGSHQIFMNIGAEPDNPWRMRRPRAAVVAGLGSEGSLRPVDLAYTVRQAAIAWAQRAVEGVADRPESFELAATLIGSGGIGMSAGQAAQSIAKGLVQANQRLIDGGWPSISHVSLIELYLDRATEAWRELQLLAAAAPDEFELADSIARSAGALRPSLSGYRGADYDYISATSTSTTGRDATISYTLDTKRARSEVYAQAVQSELTRDLVARASNVQNNQRQLGRTLFQLLVPSELQTFVATAAELVIELNPGTAAIPWELLDVKTGAGAADPTPWALRVKLLRKLRTDTPSQSAADAGTDAHVLVIGEPLTDPQYDSLPAARHEARAIVDRLSTAPGMGKDRVTKLVPDDDDSPGADAATILGTLFSRPWRIVHIAGHGEPPERPDPSDRSGDATPPEISPRGVVLSTGFLGPREIGCMPVAPEMVFINCCHSAATDASQLLSGGATGYDRPRFAASMAEQLIKLGVKCVIAAGWAVDDLAAREFAVTVYERIIAGDRFVDAVQSGREAAFRQGGDTWSAYQCYGDPDWTFRRDEAPAGGRIAPALEFAHVASQPALRIALETLALKSRFQKAAPDLQRQRLEYLEQRFAAKWGHLGNVAEGFGAAWAEAGRSPRAIDWYDRALSANDGSASIRAIQELGNLRARRAWEIADKARRQHDLSPQVVEAAAGSAEGAVAGSTGLAATNPATSDFHAQLTAARTEVTAAITIFEKLIAVRTAPERENLLASAFKRLALIEALAQSGAAESAAIDQMAQHYQASETLGRSLPIESGRPTDLFYPGMNRVAAELAINAGRPQWTGLDAAQLGLLRQELALNVKTNPDFWSVVGETELRVYEAIAASTLATALSDIQAGFKIVYQQVATPRMWSSVYDTAWLVLSHYASRASAAEQQAATELLSFLERFARPASHTD